MEIDEWVAVGVAKGYCGPVVCSTHDGIPTTFDEDQSFDDGYDFCVPVVRIYANEEEKLEVESNHSASVWRNLG
jgi:hypothetical protein